MVRIAHGGAAYWLKALPLAACVVAWSSSAFAEGSSLPYGSGGSIDPGSIIKKYNQTGELFRIEGSCRSSCTTLLAIKNVCIDPNASLSFHAAPPQRQAALLNSYNSKLRSYLVSGHYVDTPNYHTISGRDIIQKFGYRECPKR